MDPKSAQAGRFRDYIKSDEATKAWYDNMSPPEQEAHKVEWAQLKKSEMDDEHKLTTSWRKIDKTIGTPMNMGQLIINEGGWDDAAAIAGALRIAIMCTLMGGHWIGTDPQSSRKCY